MITRNIDIAIQEVMDLVVTDFILTWYADLAKDHDSFINLVRFVYLLYTRNIDIAIQEVMDLVVRDFILTWYADLAKDHDSFINLVRFVYFSTQISFYAPHRMIGGILFLSYLSVC